MQYMLMIYLDESASPTEAQRAECYAESTAFAHELQTKGQYILSAPLHPTTTATSVRPVEGRRVVTDGPFAETREQLGGFFLVDAPNLDQAIEIAKRLPGGKWGTVEIRPVVQISGLPARESVDLAAARST